MANQNHNHGVPTFDQVMASNHMQRISLVDGILDLGETAMFIARQKEGKSTFTLQLALDIACGDTFLGTYNTTKSDVLYVDYENRFHQIKERGSDLAQGREVDGLYVKAFDRMVDSDVGLFSKEFSKLKDIISSMQPWLLILDPLRYAMMNATKAGKSTSDESIALSVISQIGRLQEVCPEMSVLLVHHLKKLQDLVNKIRLADDPRSWIDRVYGSQVLLAHVDSVWGIEEDGDGYTFATVPRAHEPVMLRLLKTPESEMFILDSTAPFLKTRMQRAAWDKLPFEFGWRDATTLGLSNNLLNHVIRKAMSSGMLKRDPVTRRYMKV